jgi:hypothetical protein
VVRIDAYDVSSGYRGAVSCHERSTVVFTPIAQIYIIQRVSATAVFDCSSMRSPMIAMVCARLRDNYANNFEVPRRDECTVSEKSCGVYSIYTGDSYILFYVCTLVLLREYGVTDRSILIKILFTRF